MSDDPGRAERRAMLFVAAVIALGVIVRLLAVRAQGFPTDVGTFQAWAERLAQIGPGRFYEPGYFSDYPPAFLYVLWLLGALFDGELLRLAVKAVSIPADVAIALVAARVAWRSAGRTPAIAAAAIWSFQPGVIFAGPYWGQVDAVGTLPLFASVLVAGSRRWWLAGVLAAVAALVKPQFGIGLFVIVAAATIEFVRDARPRPVLKTIGAAVATAYVVCVPFWGLDPLRIARELTGLVQSAAGTYQYTSLYAFNGWSVFFDFWQPDAGLVGIGAILLGAGLLAAVLPLWWRRDTAALLACATLAALAFYFLPTRAHERYLFPMFALALPFAASRSRVFITYVTLALAFFTTLYYAFTRYQQYVDLRVPALIESTLFSRNGQIAIASVMIAAAIFLCWRLVRGDARLEADVAWSVPRLGVPGRGAWSLPAGLGPGRLPTRRDVAVAALVALAVLGTRGYRLDWPREMYFDEVYHARTAFELLAQREPYEWTHPHLAKEIMALGILVFGDDRVVGRDPAIDKGPPTAFAVGNDGTRAFAVANAGTPAFQGEDADDTEVVFQRPGQPEQRRELGVGIRALAISGDRVIAMLDDGLAVVSFAESPSNVGPQVERLVTLPFNNARSLSLAGDRVIVGGPTALAIYPTIGASPIVMSIPTVAVTAKTDGSEVYALDPEGVVHVIAPDVGRELRALTGGRPGTALAYALGPNRVFVARADSPTLDMFEIETGSHDSFSLANGRTGAFSSGATALAVVPRTNFLYALAEGRVVVVETHGMSPFVSIAVGDGRFLGVDGEGDKLVVAGARGADVIETGRHALAWRLPGIVFAAILAFLLVLLSRRLFASAVLPALVGLAVIVDGSMYAQARIGMNDIYVATLIVAGWYFVVAAHQGAGAQGAGAPGRAADREAGRRWATADLLIAGVCFGLALASKWAAAYALAGLFVATIAVTARSYERGRPGEGGPLDLLGGFRGEAGANRAVAALVAAVRNGVRLLTAFAVIPAALYGASYLPLFGGPTIPYGWSFTELTQQMYWYHSSLTAPHPAGSPWWSWPLVLKPVYWYFGASTGGDNAYIYDAGNVVLYWAGLVAFIWCAIASVRAKSLALAFVVFAGLVQYVAWIPIGRVLFFYHFFTVLPFYLLTLAAGLGYLWETGRARWVVAYLAAAVAAFAYFYPFISAQPFPGSQAGMFFILPTWAYECQFYPTFVCTPNIGSSFSVAALFSRLGLALVVAVGIAALLYWWRGSPLFSRLQATLRSGSRR